MNNFLDSFSFNGESPQNYETKCPLFLVLDASGSMAGVPIQEVNNALKEFQKDILGDYTTTQRLEVSIIAFNSTISCLIEPRAINTFEMPTLIANGSTKLVDAVRMAMSLAEKRKSYYKATGQNFFRPWLILLTDGEPDSDQDVVGLSNEIRRSVDERKIHFFAVGSYNFNRQKLTQICHPSTPPQSIKGTKFLEFFQWLSNSMSIVSNSQEGDKLTLPPTNSWSQIEV